MFSNKASFVAMAISAIALISVTANADVLRVFSNGCDQYSSNLANASGEFKCRYIADPSSNISVTTPTSIFVDLASPGTGTIQFQVCRQSWNLDFAPVCSPNKSFAVAAGANDFNIGASFNDVQGGNPGVEVWDYYYVRGSYSNQSKFFGTIRSTVLSGTYGITVFGWAVAN